VDVLTKIERREKRQKLRGESVCRIIEMNVEVAGDDEFMRCGCWREKKRTEFIEKDREWFRMSGRRWRTIDIKNHILDLVITSSDTSLAPAVSCTHWSPSDHFPVFTRPSINPAPLPPPTIHSFRRLHSTDAGWMIS